jgi:hypothetical protein
MRRRTPGMYAFYKNEVGHALDTGDHERVGYLISDMPYDILVELRNEGILPARRDSDGLESIENSRKRTYKVEQEWMVTYTRVLEYTIDSLGDDKLDKKQVEDMVDVPCFPTEFENGVVVDDIHPRIEIYRVETKGDRDYDVVDETMKQLQPERN